MPTTDPGTRGTQPFWSSQAVFVLVAAGSVIGLGNVWRFPFLAGRLGGGAFILVYLATMLAVALPLLAGELMVGRRAGLDPPGAFAALARAARRGPLWQIPGWLAVAASLLVLAVNAVVAGWALAHLGALLSGRAGGPAAGLVFSALISRPGLGLAGPALFLGIVALIAGGGVRRIERVMRWTVPGLLATLAILAAYAAAVTGLAGDAALLLLRPDFAALGAGGAIEAATQACFTLSLGLGVMTAYGASLPESTCIPRAAGAIAALDVAASLAAALGVLPLLLALGLRPAEGAGLVFTALPAAAATLPGGTAAAALVFLAIALAGLTSGVPLLEPAIRVATRRLGVSRWRAAAGATAASAVAGAAGSLAFNQLAGVRIQGYGLFALVNGLASEVLLPLAAAGTALFIGYVLTRRAAREELGLCGRPYLAWWMAVRWAAPAAVIGATLLRWM